MLMESNLSVLMDRMAQLDHAIDIAAICKHLISMCQVQVSEIGFLFSGKACFETRRARFGLANLLRQSHLCLLLLRAQRG